MIAKEEEELNEIRGKGEGAIRWGKRYIYGGGVRQDGTLLGTSW